MTSGFELMQKHLFLLHFTTVKSRSSFAACYQAVVTREMVNKLTVRSLSDDYEAKIITRNVEYREVTGRI